MTPSTKGLVAAAVLGCAIAACFFVSPAQRREVQTAPQAAAPSATTPAPSTPPAVKVDFTTPSPYEIGSTLRPYGFRPPKDAVRPFLGQSVTWAATFTGTSERQEEVILEFLPEKRTLPTLTVRGFSQKIDSLNLKVGSPYIVEGIIEGAHGLEIVLWGFSIKPDPR